MRKPVIAAVLLSALLWATGCANHTALVSATALGATSFVPTTPVVAPSTVSGTTAVETTETPVFSKAFVPTGQVNYTPAATEDWGGVVVTPPRPGDLPRITTDDALKVCPQAGCGSDELPEIRLGRATADDPTMNDTLVFELVWTGLQCLPAGYGGTSTEMPILEYHSCTTVVFVDATNGTDLTTVTQATS
jgi:hypothetical protein